MISGKKLTIVEKHTQKLECSDNEEEKSNDNNIILVEDQGQIQQGKIAWLT